MKTDILLKKWRIRYQRTQLAHRFAAKSMSSLHLWIGIPTTVLAAISGVLLSTDSAEGMPFSDYVEFKLFVFVLAVLVPTFTALQTFLKFEAKADAHAEADATYGEIKEELESLQTAFEEGKPNSKLPETKLNEIRARAHDMRKRAPRIPERHWIQARKIIRKSAKNSDQNVSQAETDNGDE